jgi:AcrR family transcriptional regulator
MKNKSFKPEDKLDRKQRKAVRNRKKLKESGLDVFTEKGVYETTIEDITESADLGKGTFYSHFDNKDVLFVELLEDSAEKLIDLIKSFCAQAGVQSPKNILERLLNAHIKFFKEYYENFSIIFQGQGMLNLQKEDEKEIQKPILNYIKVIETCLQSYTRATIPSIKLRKLACAVAGFVTGYFSFAIIGLSEKEIDSTLAPLKTAFLDALSTFLSEV